ADAAPAQGAMLAAHESVGLLQDGHLGGILDVALEHLQALGGSARQHAVPLPLLAVADEHVEPSTDATLQVATTNDVFDRDFAALAVKGEVSVEYIVGGRSE